MIIWHLAYLFLVNYPSWKSELVTENSCDISVLPSNPNDFADKLIKLSKEKRLINEMGNNSRRLAEVQFSRAIVAEKFENIFNIFIYA